MTTHLVIPDTQVKDGVDLAYLDWIGEYIVDLQPDNIIMMGDFADMHSLSIYDAGKRAGEGARYQRDVEVAIEAMDRLMTPMMRLNAKLRGYKNKQYSPQMTLTLGNHENRINRHVDAHPVLEGTLSTDNLEYQSFGWEVHDFLEVVAIDGVQYSHFFPRNGNGRILQSIRGAPSAFAQGVREGRSSTAGHLQGLAFSVHSVADRNIYAIIAGSCYTHDEAYLSPQGNQYWRGVIVKDDVCNGEYNPSFVSLKTLEESYR